MDLRAETNAIKLARDQGSAFRKSSESQTDAAEVIGVHFNFNHFHTFQNYVFILEHFKQIDYWKGVDFDWDLSDKTDTETQTRRGANDPHVGPADAIVQVFPQNQIKFPISVF